MAFGNAFVFVLLIAPIVFANAQTAVDWSLGKDYSSYSTQSFKPGGTLLFNYDASTHNVLVVSKSDYDNCNVGNAIQTFSDGKTSITLKQGAMYFICGIPGHCAGGMKLQVNVGGSDSATPANAPTGSIRAAPAQPKSAPAPFGSRFGSPFSAPSPRQSGGSSGLSTVGHLMFGVPLVLGVFFAFLA